MQKISAVDTGHGTLRSAQCPVTDPKPPWGKVSSLSLKLAPATWYCVRALKISITALSRMGFSSSLYYPPSSVEDQIQKQVLCFYFCFQIDKSQNYTAENLILRIRNIYICILYPYFLPL